MTEANVAARPKEPEGSEADQALFGDFKNAPFTQQPRFKDRHTFHKAKSPNNNHPHSPDKSPVATLVKAFHDLRRYPTQI